MIDSMGFNDCLLFIQEFGTDCFCLVLTTIRTFPHGLENHACKWTIFMEYVLFLESCQKTICMHGYSPFMWTGPYEYQIQGGDLSHTFKKKKDLFTWIGEQPCKQMDFLQFSRKNMYGSLPEKLSEIHLRAQLFSNSCGKVIIMVGISWSLDLRVKIMSISKILEKNHH